MVKHQYNQTERIYVLKRVQRQPAVILRREIAKPVMVNPKNLKDPKKDMAVISLAGPLTNILLSILCFIPIYVMRVNPFGDLSGASYPVQYLQMGFVLNMSLAVFNILPVPPLDGSKVLGSLLPDRIYYKVVMFPSRISIVILLILSLTGALSYVIVPMMLSVANLYYFIANLITGLFR